MTGKNQPQTQVDSFANSQWSLGKNISLFQAGSLPVFIGVVFSLETLLLWVGLLRDRQAQIEQILPEIIIGGGLFISWIIALIVYLVQKTEQSTPKSLHWENENYSDTKPSSNSADINLALNATKTGIWYLNLLGNQAVTSEQTANLFNIQKASFSGDYEAFAQFVHPDDLEVVNQAILEAIKNQSFLDLKYRIVKPDRTIVWVKSQGEIFSDDTGKPIRIIGTINDITEQQKIEEDLIASESRYRLLFESNPHPMWVYDLQSLKFLAVNEAAIRHYQYSEKEFLSTTIATIHLPGYARSFSSEAFGTQPEINNSGIWKHRKKDGTIIDVEISSHPIKFDSCLARLVLAYDVTERQRIETKILLLQSITKEIIDADTFAAALEITITKLCEVTGWNYAEAWSINYRENNLQLSAFWYGDHPKLKQFRQKSKQFSFRKNEGIPGRVWATQKPEWTNDVSSCSETEFLRVDLAKEVGLKGALGIPIIAKGKIVTILVFFSCQVLQEDEKIVQLVTSVANQLGLAIATKQAESALRQSEQYLRGIIDNEPECVKLVASDGTLLDMNAAGLAMLEMDNPRKVINKPIYGAIAPEYRPAYQALNESVCAGNKESLEFEIVTSKGNRRWMETRAVPILDQAQNSYIQLAISRDITERKQAESALRESQRTLATLMSNLPGMAYRGKNDREWTMEFVSQGSLELVGYQPEELIGNRVISFGELIDCGDRERAYLQVQQALSEKQAFKLVYRVTTKSGEQKWLWEKGEGIFSEDGELIALEGFISDISDRVRAEQALKELNQTLELRVQQRTAQFEATNRELEAFSYSVSHDLRAPLRRIEGFSQIVCDSYSQQIDARGQKYLQRIRANVQKMNELIDSLLLLSRLTRTEIQYTQVNLSHLAEEIATELQQSQPQRQGEFSINPEIFVQGSRELLQIALENLLNNAWKYTSGNSTAKIEFGVLTQAEPSQNLVQRSPIYFVRDNGVGFDMAYADKLFRVFERLHSERDFPGTGIGLATVARIIHRHGGKVWAEAAPNQGATFYFTLS
ncbi:MAG: PAS domain S-box protein [Oscillatoria sp. PMC 1068.18]|nr:PAS domain S-box protein [Oscillatoria sp. PMC 1076.18]MEC4987612.1 PAS domain S-box protein [Oscillatoria sp. PMC 1068.18]